MSYFIIRQLFLMSLLSFCISEIYSQDLQLQWVKGITGTDLIIGGDIVIDNQKNLYTIGRFYGIADFDPGSGTKSLSAADGAYYLAKYDAQGNYVFAFQTKASVETIIIDNSGNLCIAGSYDSTIDFDYGVGIVTLPSISGSFNYYIARYDKNGNYVKAFPIANGSKKIEFLAMTEDVSNNFYVTGGFLGTADFDPSSAVLNLVANGNSSAQDIFLSKYSSVGSLIFAFKLGGSNSDYSRAIAVDPNDNVYIAGFFHGSIDLDPGSGISSFNFSGLNGFIGKYGPSGNYLAGYGLDAVLYTIALDKAGNIYTTGHVQDSMDVDPGPGVLKLYSKNITTFIEKLDATGNLQYAYQFKNNGYCLEYGLTMNEQNNFYLFGYLDDTTYFNPKGNTGVLTTNGRNDGYVTKFDASGNFKSGFSFGSSAADVAKGLAIDNQGGVWIAGTFTGTVDFDPAASVANLTATPKGGVFFGRYLDPESASISRSQISQSPIKIYGADNKVFVDFTALDKVDAQIKVVNMMGQTIAETTHFTQETIKIELPQTNGQVCIVIVSTAGSIITRKVWVE